MNIHPKNLLFIIVLLSLSSGIFHTLHSQVNAPVLSEDFPHFLEKVYNMDTIPAPPRWSATAQETVTLYKDEDFSEIKGRAIKTKQYLYEGDEIIEEEVLKESIEGDYPDRKGKRGTFEGKEMPFTREAENEYQYMDYGIVNVDGAEARKISFKSVERDDEHFDGVAYFHPETALLLIMEVTYADNPTAIKDWRAVMTFTYVDGYRIMDDFEMDLRGSVLFLIKFNVRVRQHFNSIKVFN